ncbi:biotin/lipoyl-binding protein [Lachnospiraceae bacterium]|nr:biotin/lipoyl-binding protein [Lachnospiraceae bacterium]
MKKRAGNWKQLSRKKKALLILAFAAGAGVISFGIYSVKATPAKEGADRSRAVQEVQAQTGSISDTMVGTGNLELQEGETVTIPSGLIVEEVKVESGDSVSEGDVLAVVNQTSVLGALEEVQEQIEKLDEKIDESKDDTDAGYIKSKVDARVKKIFVQEGQEIADCMLEQGALMLLSLDGYLAVEIETNAEPARGDSVTVLRSDGTQKEGTVETVSGGTCKILCTDSGIGMGEQVIIADADGNELGTGSTSIHQQLAVTAAAGIVEDICVSEDQKVYTDTRLMSLDNSGQSLEYQELMAERQELAATLQKLIKIAQSGTITAEAEGIVQSVNISAEASQNEGEAGNLQVSKHSASVVASAAAAEEQIQEEEALTLEITDSGTSGKSSLMVQTPETGAKPQKEIKTEDGSYTGTISWKPEHKVFVEKTSYQASVTLHAADGYSFTGDSISRVKTGILSGVMVSEDGKNLSLQLTYPFTEAEKQEEQKEKNKTDLPENNEDQKKSENGSTTETNDENSIEAGKKTETQNHNTVGNETVQVQNQGEIMQNASGNTAASGGSGTKTAATAVLTDSEEESAEYANSSSEVAAFTLAAADTMILSVYVDELDINSAAVGQQAEITLDALEGEQFTGTVTKVGSAASSSSGGVAKYTVNIAIPRDERMKEGMNASATITIEKREDVVVLPVNALQERGNRVFVYKQAESDGTLSGEQEVRTGLSDGDMVEITEGLSDGDKVYYLKSGNTSQQGSGRMEGVPDWGEMPLGGPGGDREEIPQGFFQGGESGRGMPGAMGKE